MAVNRRTVLTRAIGLGLAPWLPSMARAALPREVDVVVVGAGAAGIAAARRIMSQGRSVALIEAAATVGGRARTALTTADVAYDLGAQALYTPDTNPLVRLARIMGIDIAMARSGQRIRIGRRFARASEIEDYFAALARASNAIAEAARGRTDVSCATALPKDLGEWGPSIDYALGPLMTGRELNRVSVVDMARAQPRTITAFARQGVGTLVLRLAQALPVALATPATRIDWSARGVAVDTPAGRITARAALVTVSSNVLAAGAIKFNPPLPARVMEACAALALGHQERVVLDMPGNPLGLGRDETVIEKIESGNGAMLRANLGGSSLMAVDIAGPMAARLSGEGDAAMTAFARDWITRLFGADAVAKTATVATTGWSDDPLIRGAGSIASPGAAGARAVLATTPTGALFLAGEATHETLWGTLAGAWESGERAAEAALKQIAAAPAAPAKRRR